MRIEIKKINGKWTVNGKPYHQLIAEEKSFFDEFLIAMKLDYNLEKKFQPISMIHNYVIPNEA